MVPALSVVIPVYQAQEYLSANVENLISCLDQKEISFEILLRDDRSCDNSPMICRDLAQRHKEVRRFSNDHNAGLGSTLRALFAEARGAVIIYSDADLPFGAEAVTSLYDNFMRDQAQILVASRYSGVSNQVSLLRKVMSRWYYRYCRNKFGIRVRDIGSGLVVFDAQSLRKLKLTTKRFGIHAEIFIEAQRNHLTVREVPMVSLKQKFSTFSIWRHGIQVLRETSRLGQNNRGKD